MSNKFTSNNNPTLVAVSNADNNTPVYLWADPTTKRLLVNSGGTLVPEDYDYIAAGYPTDTTETYTYKSGGSSGTTIATVTVTYMDDTKAEVSSVERS